MDIVLSIIIGVTANGLYDSLKDVMEQSQINKICNELQGMATPEILAYHKNELYYNDLDAYITKNDIVPLVVRFCYNKQILEFLTKSEFTTLHTEEFLKLHKNFANLKSTISNIFWNLYVTIDKAINNCGFNQETRKITNQIRAESKEILLKSIESAEQLSEMQASLQNLEQITEQILRNQSHNPALSKNPNSDSFPDDEVYAQHYSRIKEIIDTNQTVESFPKAIKELNETIHDILENITQVSEDNRHLLLLYLYDTQAQYHANMGDLEQALQLIARADNQRGTQDKADYKRHYFIHAYILFQFHDNYKYKDSLILLEKAIALDNTYHAAVLLKFNLDAILLNSSFDEQLSSLEQYFKLHIESTDDNALLCDYFQSLGLLYSRYENYEIAIEAIEIAEEYQHCEENAANIAIAYYYWSVGKNPKGAVLHRSNIDYSKMLKSMEIMTDLLAKPEKLHVLLRNMLIPYYVSASYFCGQYKRVAHIEEYIKYADTDYQTVRNVVFGKSYLGLIDESDIEALTEEDKALIVMMKTVESGDLDLAIKGLEGKIETLPYENAKSLYQNLLGLYIRNREIEKYKACIQKMSDIGLSDVYYGLHCLMIAELEGDIEKAKEAFTRCLREPFDAAIVYEMRDFLIRNNLDAELIEFYKNIHNQIFEKSFAIDEVDCFYGKAIEFLIQKDYALARKIYEQLPRNFISDLTYYKIEVLIFGIVSDHASLIQSYGNLYSLRKGITDKIGQAQSYRSMMDISGAENAISEALAHTGLSNEEKSMCYALMSELCLYKEDYEESYKYAKKNAEMNEHIPSHPSHQALLAISMHCNKIDEGVMRALAHKEKNPVVVDWLKTISIPTDEDGEIIPETIFATFKDVLGDSGSSFKNLVEGYRKQYFTIYHLSELFNTTLANTLSWHELYKLKMRIFSGSIDLLQGEVDVIGDEIIVDALTLLILAKTELLFLLNDYKKVYISASSVEKIQSEYLNGLRMGSRYTVCAYRHIEKEKNIHIYPNTPLITADMERFRLPKYLYDALEYAYTNDIHFLYADESMLNYIEALSERNPTFISILAILKKHNNKEKSSMFRFKLLKCDYQFINFDADDMYYQLFLNDFKFKKTDMEPFFRCKSHHDMYSFGNVYYLLASKLIYEDQKRCAIDLVIYVFRFLDKTSKRSEHYYNPKSHNWLNSDDAKRYIIMQRFVYFTLVLLVGLLYRNGSQYKAVIDNYEFLYILPDTINKVKERCQTEFGNTLPV